MMKERERERGGEKEKKERKREKKKGYTRENEKEIVKKWEREWEEENEKKWEKKTVRRGERNRDGALGNAKYPFTSITPRSTQAGCDSTWKGRSIGQIELNCAKLNSLKLNCFDI